jgi:hypothetical protein
MPSSTPLESQLPGATVLAQARTAAPCDVRALISLAVSGLVAMLDRGKQLFCHRLLWTEQGPMREGLSQRYTIIALLGLRKLELIGIELPFDIQAIYSSVVRNMNWIQGVGDLGLLIWLKAAFQPDQLEDFFCAFDCESALDRYSDARESHTMELAWFLTGLAHAAGTSTKLASSLTDLSVETYHRIEENQDEYGLFGHMNVKKSLAGRLRGRIGSFADQVYPIYAMAKFASIFHVEDPLGPALECATAVCGAQGGLGQWWWLHDTCSGQVSSRYPVYSVHQHGMAPMALFAIEEATGQCFHEFVYKGLNWICGGNELGLDMRDTAKNLIWRCMLPRNSQTKFWEMALHVVRPPDKDMQPRSLKILCEQRPYEFGWLLFAFSKNAQAKPLFGT